MVSAEECKLLEERAVVVVKDLLMKYDDRDVLKGVNFSAQHGEILCLLGPNGAGKTTTIEILEGFRSPSAGDVNVLGVNPTYGDDAWRSRIGVVLQSWRDHGKWRIRELLDYLGRFYVPFSSAEIKRPWDIDELLEIVGLKDQANSKLMSLSGGQRRRVDAAIGLIGRPELIFLDEPTAGMDPHARLEFHGMIKRLSDIQNTAILMTTHDLKEAEKLADRIVVMDDGKIIADGTVEQLTNQLSIGAEVRWVSDGRKHSRTLGDADPTAFVRDLLGKDKSITGLEIRLANLEDTYLALVKKAEASQ